MSRFKVVLGLVMVPIILGACGRSAETENLSEVVFEEITDESSSAANNGETTEKISSVSEYLQYIDTEFLENEESYLGTPAVIRYDEFLKDKNNWPDSDYKSIHVALGLIDDDDIPELFVALDTVSVFGVHIYKYDPESDSVIYLGEFSQYGFCKYSEKKNRIWGQYGNNGYFENYYYEIVGNEVKVVGRLLSDGAFEEIKYYADYADMDESGEVITHVDPVSRPDDSFCISEQEFEQRDEEYMQTKEPIMIGYNNMAEMIIKGE